MKVDLGQNSDMKIGCATMFPASQFDMKRGDLDIRRLWTTHRGEREREI